MDVYVCLCTKPVCAQRAVKKIEKKNVPFTQNEMYEFKVIEKYIFIKLSFFTQA